MKKTIYILIAFCSILYTHANDNYYAKIVGVSDGDTVTALKLGNQQIKIRLDEIDAPELSQDYGRAAKKALSAMIFGKNIIVSPHGKDGYGRIIATLYSNTTNINQQLVSQGYAWQYKKYSKNEVLAAAETQARLDKQGLWHQHNAIAPWEYRTQQKKESYLKRNQQNNTPEIYWINTNSGVRHNSSCRSYENTKLGKHTSNPTAGTACARCGG